jgi:hypothetical protein
MGQLCRPHNRSKAKRVLDLCYSGLVDSAKLAFNGVGAEASAKVDWLAATAINQIEAAHARYIEA